MKIEKETLLLYAITDCDNLQGEALLDRTEKILANGATILQYRDKEKKAREDVKALQALCKKYEVPFIVNDDIELAIEIDADGVHVGQEDLACHNARERLGADKIIGVSAKTVAQAKEAVANGADYLGVGALFPSVSKSSSVIARETLKEICAAVDVPVVGIGGISEDNIALMAGTGAAGVAVISALYALPEPSVATKRFARKMNNIINGDPAMKGVLLDVDGTIADTAGFYQQLVPNFLKSEGLRVGPDLPQILAPLSMPESVGYVKHNYSGLFGVGQVVNHLEHTLEMFYHTEAVAKKDVEKFIVTAREKGCKIFATSIHDAEVCTTLFDHLGLTSLFDHIISGWDKRFGGGDSKLFAQAHPFFDNDIEHVWVFNDGIEGIFAAKGAGYKLAAIYDEHHSEQEWLQMVKNADVAFMSWEEAISWLK